MKILVTGANGFIGSALCKILAEQGYKVKAAMRTPLDSFKLYPTIETCLIQEIDETNWQLLVQDVDVIIHLAARVHQMNDTVENMEAEYHRINVLGTEKILDAALATSVKRFVFLSSVKVNGENSSLTAFTELDEPMPQDPYAMSKWQAEQLLYKKTRGKDLDFVVLRTPLVYGKGVKANFANLVKLIKYKVPTPFALVRNQRSLIYIENLISALSLVSVHPKAKGRTYFVADAELVSTPELIREVALVLGVRSWLLPIPPSLLKYLAKCLGKEVWLQRLLDNLAVDTSLIKKELAWTPSISLTEALYRTLKK